MLVARAAARKSQQAASSRKHASHRGSTAYASMSSFDAVINTAPAQVLGELSALRDGCILLELASAPGGLDPQAAQDGGMRYISAPGLPGKYAPVSAARLIYGAVTNIFKECGICE